MGRSARLFREKDTANNILSQNRSQIRVHSALFGPASLVLLWPSAPLAEWQERAEGEGGQPPLAARSVLLLSFFSFFFPHPWKEAAHPDDDDGAIFHDLNRDDLDLIVDLQ